MPVRGDRDSYREGMAQLGADDVEVDRLAATFDSTAARLRTSEESITSSVQSVTWLGPDADSFRTKWKSGMKAQLTTVSERLTGLAKELRAQAEAQRGASDGADVPVTPSAFERFIDNARDWLEERIEEARRIRELDEWADEHGRQQIRDVADETPAPSTSGGWRSPRTSAPRCCATIPARCSGSRGSRRPCAPTPATAYLDSVRGDIELSSTEDKIAGELNIAWVHLGVEGSAAIVELADGTYRVDLALDGEIGANLGIKGAKGHVGLGAGVAQSYRVRLPGRGRGVRRRALREADPGRRPVGASPDPGG